MVPVDERFLTLTEVAERLSVSRRYVEQLVSRGELPSYRVGGRARRISQSDLDQFLLTRREEGRRVRPAKRRVRGGANEAS